MNKPVSTLDDPADVLRRIERRVALDNLFGCHEVMKNLDADGYARIRVMSEGRVRITGVHRAITIATHGAVPSDMQIDHLCRNRRCCNPDHLEVVTPSVNTLRSNHSNKKGRSGTRPSGRRGCKVHAMTDGRLYLRPDGYSAWICRPCTAERMRKHAQKQRTI